jgi:hypothetical protein
MPVTTRSRSKTGKGRAVDREEEEQESYEEEQEQVHTKRGRKRRASATSGERTSSAPAPPSRSATTTRRTRRKTDTPVVETTADDEQREGNEEVPSASSEPSVAAAPSAEGSRQHTVAVLEGDWVPGQVDLRTRAPLLMRILAELYRFRWNQDRNDRFKMIHWRKMANLLEEQPNPVKTEEDIEALSAIRGVGVSTMSVLQEIYETGYLDWIDDLMVEVEQIVNDRGVADRVIAFGELQTRAEGLGERNAERRAAQRRNLVAISARNGVDNKNAARVENVMKNGIVVTGAQRRKLLEVQQSAGASSSSSSSSAPAVSPSKEPVYSTRGATQKQLVKRALHAAISSDDCAVCLEDYNDSDKLMVFECEHCFHMDCITHWLSSRVANGIQPHCPLCRRPIQMKKK